jgi:hypothetical protein
MTGNVTPLVPIRVITDGLRDNCERLVRELLPNGSREHHEWREASKSKGGLGDSLCVHIGGGKSRGLWMMCGGAESGDLLDLIAFLKFSGSKKDAIAWAKAWLGLDGGDPEALKRAQSQPARAASSEPDDQDAEQRRNGAWGIYLASAANIIDTPAHAYLRGRGADVARLPYPVRALRFHPNLWERTSNRKWPAMVAAMTGSGGQFMAVHRTYLEVLSDGRVRKAPVFDDKGKNVAKRTFGNFKGAAIRLWRGTRVDPKTGEVKQARRLSELQSGVWVDVIEGIEDGLSVALADNEARVLCAGSVGNLRNIKLPPCVEGVVLWRDNDAPGCLADIAAAKAAEHFAAMGKRVTEVRVPADYKDVNAWLQALIAQRAGEKLAL